jgi:hypothetical protein
MSQEQRDAVDQMMREGPLDLGGELMEQRVILEQMLTSTPLADDVSTTPQTLGATPVVAIDISGTESNDVTLDVTPGVPHVFQAFAAILDEGEAALARAGAFLRSHLTSTVEG